MIGTSRTDIASRKDTSGGDYQAKESLRLPRVSVLEKPRRRDQAAGSPEEQKETEAEPQTGNPPKQRAKINPVLQGAGMDTSSAPMRAC